jgi:hypothetical protein
MAFPDHSRLEKKYGEVVHIDLENCFVELKNGEKNSV